MSARQSPLRQPRGYRQAVARLRRSGDREAKAERLGRWLLPAQAAVALIVVVAFSIGGYLAWNRAAGDPTGACGYYETSRGGTVLRPCGNWWFNSTTPAGATAKCWDGTWTWSRRPDAPGTCSHHWGVYARL